MKRCWIHIGMHKTGSTTIQKNLNEVGRSDGWRYITLEKNRGNLNMAMFAMFARQPRKFHGFRSSGTTPEKIARIGKRMREKLKRRIQKASEETIILSAESLDQLDRKGVGQLERFLRPHFDEIRVIGYVRPPHGFASSSFQEKVKHGKKVFSLSRCDSRYKFRFKKYDEVFGASHVKLIKFDPKAFKNNCVLSDFCEQVGISLPEGTVVTRVNEGLCLQACGILFAYHKYGPGYGVGKYVLRENRFLVRSLIAMEGAKFRLSSSLTAATLAENAGDIRWMEKRLGVSLSENVSADGAISSEEELLRIEPSALAEFARSFESIVRVKPPALPPNSGGLVRPEQAAAYVQACRELAGNKLRAADQAAANRRGGIVSTWVRKFRKAVGLSRS